MEQIANWRHNSGKPKRTKGTCKGRVRANKQRLQALKQQLKAK